MQEAIKVYTNASQTQLSIGRHYGGATVNGNKYVWDYANDALVLATYKKEWAKIAQNKPKYTP